MEPINKIAGRLLLYFYALQRQNAFPSMEIVSFFGIQENKTEMESSSNFVKGMLKVSKKSAADIYNSLRYLKEKRFIDFKEVKTTIGDLLHNIEVTAWGVDIVEGIERSEEEKKKFNITFNIKIADNINIDSLIKNELGSLFKASLL